MLRAADPRGRSSFMLWYFDPCARSAYGHPSPGHRAANKINDDSDRLPLRVVETLIKPVLEHGGCVDLPHHNHYRAYPIHHGLLRSLELAGI